MTSVNLIDKWLLMQAALADPELTPAAKVVLGRLLFHLNAGTGQCTPSFETLARGGAMARRTAVRSVKELRAAGWISTERAALGSFILAFDRVPPASEPGTKPSPPARDETVPRVGTKRGPELGTKPSPKQGKREQGKGTWESPVVPKPFDEWWPVYPKKVGKDAARRAFHRVLKARRATVADLMAGAERYAAERMGDDPKFTKHPTSWLNGGHWADEPAPPSRGGRSRHPYSALERLMEDPDDGE